MAESADNPLFAAATVSSRRMSTKAFYITLLQLMTWDKEDSKYGNISQQKNQISDLHFRTSALKWNEIEGSFFLHMKIWYIWAFESSFHVFILIGLHLRPF